MSLERSLWPLRGNGRVGRGKVGPGRGEGQTPGLRTRQGRRHLVSSELNESRSLTTLCLGTQGQASPRLLSPPAGSSGPATQPESDAPLPPTHSSTHPWVPCLWGEAQPLLPPLANFARSVLPAWTIRETQGASSSSSLLTCKPGKSVAPAFGVDSR